MLSRRKGSEALVKAVNLPARLFGWSLAAITARNRRQTLCFSHSGTLFLTLYCFFVELLRFTGWAAECRDVANDERPTSGADCQFKHVARVQFPRRLDRVAVELDVTGLNGCRCQ